MGKVFGKGMSLAKKLDKMDKRTASIEDLEGPRGAEELKRLIKKR